MMKRLIAFLLVMFLPSVSMALVGSIDHREYVDWSSPEYNKIVYFDAGDGICTAEYVYYDIILTARHCVVDTKGYIRNYYKITLSDGRKTDIRLERYGKDAKTGDWALLRVLDSNFYKKGYFNVPDKTSFGTVQNAGFGWMRILSDKEIQTAKQVWSEVEAQYKNINFNEKIDIVEGRLGKIGINLIDDPDPNTGVMYKFKADPRCELQSFDYIIPGEVKSTCDGMGGNSGGPYFWNGDFQAIHCSGIRSFDDKDAKGFGFANEVFVKELREMQKLSGTPPTDTDGNNQTANTAQNKNSCLVNGEEYEDGKVYRKSRYDCTKYNKWYNFGLDLSNVRDCICKCQAGRMTCEIGDCYTFSKKQDGKCVSADGADGAQQQKPTVTTPGVPSDIPQVTDKNICLVDGNKYIDDGRIYSLSVFDCAKYNAALDLTKVSTCNCTCHENKMDCNIGTCQQGYRLENGQCVDEQPANEPPVATGQKACFVDGARYDDGESRIVLLQWCKKQNPSLDTRNASNCECTCQNGEMNCQIKNCMKRYDLVDGKCVLSQTSSQNPSSQQSLFQQPQLGVSGIQNTPGASVVHIARPSGSDQSLFSDDYIEQQQQDLDAEADALNNMAKNIDTMTDREFFAFLSRAVDLSVLRKNYEDALARERALSNRILGAAAIGAGGIGGAMLGAAIAEQRADAAAEQEMQAYLQSVRCEYGNGKSVPGGETNVELPGGNDMVALYTEYATLANDLKIRKDALGLRPGIESEVVIDKADTGLYDNVGVGIVGGGYASIARALMNPDGDDAKAWVAQREKTATTFKAGGIVAGTGIVGGAVGNIAINGFDGKKLDVNPEPTDSESGESQITK